jgi:adenine-specific DNA-methyltransferase
MNTGERQLAALAGAFIADRTQLTTAERRLIARAPVISRRTLAENRKNIRAGLDPLGDRFCELRSSAQRRELGAVYTPAAIVEAMVEWAHVEHVTPTRIVDPGAGSGRYLIAAARLFPLAKLIAVDVDPLAMLVLRANASVLGFAERLSVHLVDYRALELPAVDGATLFIGNPPYVRHHDIDEHWKTWFATTAAHFGGSASKLAGLHIHFFLKTRQLARPGDFGTFITAAEWLDVNYGSVLRKMLADGLAVLRFTSSTRKRSPSRMRSPQVLSLVSTWAIVPIG